MAGTFQSIWQPLSMVPEKTTRATRSQTAAGEW
jgi:hypothetical protein